jgi:hypothetical protein
MDYRLGGYECPGCGRLIVPQELMPELPAPQVLIKPPPAAPSSSDPAAPVLSPAEAPAAPPGYPFPLAAGPPFNLPPTLDGNTSGMGNSAVLPPQSNGSTMGGWLPLGLFAFFNGDLIWGVVGLVGTFLFIPGLVYWFYVSSEGRKLAWRRRRFSSLAQYAKVMDAWHMAGLLFTLIGGLIAIVATYIIAKGVEAHMQQMFPGL